MKVAVILTGQLRYLDWCSSWWQSVKEESQHDITFYSSTWYYNKTHDNNISFVKSRNRNTLEKVHQLNLGNMYPNIDFVYSDFAELQKYWKKYDNLNDYFTYPKDSMGYDLEKAFKEFQYYFGRLYHVCKAVDTFDLSTYDKVVHSRWDTLIRPTHFDHFIKDDWVFSAVQQDPDPKNQTELLHSNDFLYSGNCTSFIELYKDTFKVMEDVLTRVTECQQQNFELGSKYMIGHSLFVNHIKEKGENISNLLYTDSTLFRNYQIAFKYSDQVWKDQQYCYYVDIGHIRDSTRKKSKIFQ